MREIKFRGRDEHGEWHYGAFMGVFYDGVVAPIEYANIYVDGMATRVLPNTVGQFTGRTDVMRKEAYEGDIIKCYDDRAHELVGVIKWSDKACCWYMDCTVMGCGYFPFDIHYAFEIIGNIYDNFDTTTFICWRLNHELPAEHHARRSAADDMECVVVDGKTREELGDA